MSRFPGVGQRVRQRLRALGYWKDGRPDVGRFCSERDYRPQYLYACLGDRLPTYDNLARLARDLEVPPEWVMFGTGSPTRRDALDAVDATRGPRRGAQIIDFARLRDVTSKLVRLEAELEAIFRAFPDLYVWLDTEGRVLAYEGGSGGSFDVSLELARGKKIADVFPSASGLRLEAALRQFLDAPSPVSTEFALGAKRYEARLLPLPVESGAQRQLLMIVRDITDGRQGEEATPALARVGHELVGTLDLEEATARVVTAVLHHFRVDRACFFELDRTSGNLLCVATAGEHGDAQWTGRMIPAGASVAALAVQECRPVAARDVTTDPRVDLPAWLRERAAVEGHKSVVAVPLVSRGEVLGALSLASSTEREFSELELGLLTGFGATAALALENARRFHETEQGKALAQAAAAHSERRLRNLAQDLTAIVWEVDAATWRTIYVGHAAEKILGYPVERWYTEGDFWLSHLRPDDRGRPIERGRRVRLEPAARDGPGRARHAGAARRLLGRRSRRSPRRLHARGARPDRARDGARRARGPADRAGDGHRRPGRRRPGGPRLRRAGDPSCGGVRRPGRGGVGRRPAPRGGEPCARFPAIRRRESSRHRADDRRPRADHLLQRVGREGLRLGGEGAPRAARQRLLQGRDGRGAGAHAPAPRRDARAGLPDDVPEEGGRLGRDRHLRGARARRARRSRRNGRHGGGRGSLRLASPAARTAGPALDFAVLWSDSYPHHGEARH